MLSLSRVQQAMLQGVGVVVQISVWEGHRCYLRFASDFRTFEFRVLPFSTMLAPQMFTRCMDTVLVPLRPEGGRCILVCACSKVQCCNNMMQLLQHLGHLCLHLDSRKSTLQHSQSTELPSICLDAKAGSLSFWEDRLHLGLACPSSFWGPG